MASAKHSIHRIASRLYRGGGHRFDGLTAETTGGHGNGRVHSVVAFLLRPGDDGAPALLLTRRSTYVRQPGDLCCPGGGAEPERDARIARFLAIPGSPLALWPYYGRWRRDPGRHVVGLPTVMATALRECFEEIRLLPVGVRFLGMLPAQELVLFRRVIYPLVFWVPWQRRFFPNWEVDAMVAISIADLMTPARYVRYRLRFADAAGHPAAGTAIKDFQGLRYDDSGASTRILWGATFRMAMDYLRIVHGFVPPPLAALPAVSRTIGRDYITGNGADRS